MTKDLVFKHKRRNQTKGFVGLSLRRNAPVRKDGTFVAPARYREALTRVGHRVVGEVEPEKPTKPGGAKATEQVEQRSDEDQEEPELPAEDDVEAWQALAKEHGVKSYWLIKDLEKLRARVREAMGLSAQESAGEDA